MFVNSTITSTTIMHTIAIASIVSSNRLECVCRGGNSICRFWSSMCRPFRSVALDGPGAAGQDQPAGMQPTVLPVHPVHEHGDHHDDAEHRDDVVRAGRAAAVLAVRAAGAERHDALAVLVS